ncbi:MAG: hypothetical protein Q7R91_00265 [bacterium]|nr:hypothetical protein [bacterium]
MNGFMQWFREKKKETLTALALTVFLGVTVGPFLAARLYGFATDLLGTVVALLVLAGIIVLTPTILYRISLLAYRDKQRAIEKDPTAALMIDLKGFREDVAEGEKTLSAFDGDIAAIDEVLRVRAKHLRPEDVAFFKEQQRVLVEDRGTFERGLTENCHELGEFEAEVVRAGVMQDIGNRMQKAADRLAPTHKRGMESDETLTALRALASRVASARSQLRISLERSTLAVLQLPAGGNVSVFELPSQKPRVLVQRNPTP